MNVSDAIRKAIRDSGRSLYDLAKTTDIDAGRLSRFMRKERTLGSDAIDVLCQELGLNLTPKKSRSRNHGCP